MSIAIPQLHMVRQQKACFPFTNFNLFEISAFAFRLCLQHFCDSPLANSPPTCPNFVPCEAGVRARVCVCVCLLHDGNRTAENSNLRPAWCASSRQPRLGPGWLAVTEGISLGTQAQSTSNTKQTPSPAAWVVLLGWKALQSVVCQSCAEWLCLCVAFCHICVFIGGEAELLRPGTRAAHVHVYTYSPLQTVHPGRNWHIHPHCVLPRNIQFRFFF